MRIAFITFEYPPFLIGGAGVYAEKLTNELVKLGHEVIVFTPKADRKSNGSMQGPQIIEVDVKNDLFLISLQFWLNLPKIMRDVHRKNPFDIVHVNGSSYWFVPGKIIDVPHVVTVHHLAKDAQSYQSGLSGFTSLLYGESSVIYQTLERRVVKFADRIIAVSNHTKCRILETYDYPQNKITAIHNGNEPPQNIINMEQIVDFKNRFNLDDRPIILFVGRIDDPRKGLDVLLEAFLMVLKNVDSQLLIVGKGDEKAVLKKARDIGINNNISITGFLNSNDLACSYFICDVYVCPSLMEGFGLTVLEATSWGKKIVATNVGAIPEISDSNVDIVEPNHPELLASALKKALLSKGEISTNCGIFTSMFSWLESAKKTEKVYLNKF